MKAPIILAIIAILVFRYWYTSNEVVTEQFATDSSSIKRISVKNNPNFFQDIVKANVPVILTNSIDKWPALRTFKNCNYLASQMTSQLSVFNSTDPTFVYYEAPNVKNYGLETPRPFRKESMTMKEFCNTIANKDDKNYYYVIEKIDNYPIIKDVSPNEWMRIPFYGNDQSEMNMWIGKANVTARLHYDCEFNFYAQLVGRKKWILVPPSQWENAYLFPTVHAHDRQTQVDFENPDLEKFPKYNKVKENAFEIILKEGEVLYLPPFWFHQVEALDFSVSVNTWTHALEFHLLQQIFTFQVPLNPNAPLSQNHLTMAAFFKLVIDNVSEMSPSHVIELTLEKYKYIDELKINKDSKFCEDMQMVEDYMNDIHIQNFAHPVIQTFMHMKDKIQRDIMLVNYIEIFTFHAIGLQDMVPFWQQCFK